MSKARLFLISFLLTLVVMLAVIYHGRPPAAPKLTPITSNVYIASQLKPADLRALRIHRIKTIVDIRPDGEASDQAPSSEIALAAKKNRLAFHYIPVPHGSIPDDAVDALSDVLSHEVMPTVLYCRSGRRAVRTFALASASRWDGPSLDSILEMVRNAGFTADDLKSNITERIARRSNAANLEK